MKTLTINAGIASAVMISEVTSFDEAAVPALINASAPCEINENLLGKCKKIPRGTGTFPRRRQYENMRVRAI